MTSTTEKSALAQGMLAGLPFVVFAIPFALLFGVVATEAGFNVAEVMGFSLLVIAGAAQFTAVQLMTENAPVWVVLAAALAVNLRMAMYSASLQPHLGTLPFGKRALVAYCNIDQTFAVSSAKFENAPAMTVDDKYSFFMGVMIPVMPLWVIFTYVGAIVGSAIPETLELEFAMPILFLALVGPMLRTLPHVVAAFVSVVASLILAGLPSGFGVLLAGMVAMAAGAEVERRMAG